MATMGSLVTQLKRVYVDIVRRRSSVRMVETSAVDYEMPVHFLLGNYRSGTTALRFSLGTHPDVAAPPETEFLANLMPVCTERRSLLGLDGMGFSGDAAERFVRRSAQYFYGNYADSLDAKVLVDKTPAYTLSLIHI